jgi:predicted unusual protein kinase regulating ubiquinone biosynthesis (AarF/ABC1/UbiB family)
LDEIGSRFAKFGQTISARLDIAKARKTLIFRAF